MRIEELLHAKMLERGLIPSTNGDDPYSDIPHPAETETWADSGTEPTPGSSLLLVDWPTAFNRPPIEAIVDGYVFPGRWTANVAPAKLGKSTLTLHIGHTLASGIDPFHGTPRNPIGVLYLDGEMGEADVIERLTDLELGPIDLTHFHYSDLFPKADTIQGGAAIVSTANALAVSVVILDGLNAFVTGAEKDDTPWRNLYEQTVAPLKRAGIAVVSSDNTGKDVTLSARGSSAKLDKADAIIMLKRTDDGINLTTTHQRTSGYLRSIDLTISGLNGEKPIDYRQVEGSWPAGTKAAADLLERLAIPVDHGRRKIRTILKQGGHGIRNDVLTAAIRYRKMVGDTCPGHVSPADFTDVSGTHSDK